MRWGKGGRGTNPRRPESLADLVLPSESMVLDPDSPLKDPADDKLGYSDFARAIARGLAQMSSSAGMVVGIYGPWGSGKTSTANFIISEFEKFDKETRPIVVRFSPWWFTGDPSDLLQRFFLQLRRELAAVKDTVSKTQDLLSSLGGLLDEYSDALADAPVPYVSKVAKFMKKLRTEKKSPSQIKDAIAEILAGQERRVIVVIDDIDRLPPDEVAQVMRLVKAVADFPNVIYILLFDREVVEKSLESAYPGIHGGSYLEKIVQVSFELPEPSTTALGSIFTDGLDVILSGISEKDFDQERWVNIYRKSISRLLRSPRNVVCLLNMLRVSFPAVMGEVNPVDFIALECLRMTSRNTYRLIAANQEKFVPIIPERYRDKTDVDFHRQWLEQLPVEIREPAREIVAFLFPRVGPPVQDNRTGYSDTSDDIWQRDLRVCSKVFFSTYFRLAPLPEAVTESEMRELLAIRNPDEFGKRLVLFSEQRLRDKTTKARQVLDRLAVAVSNSSDHALAEVIIFALFSVGDLLAASEAPRPVMTDFDISLRISWVVRPLLQSMDEQARFNLIQRAVLGGAATGIIVNQVWWFGVQHGKYSKDNKRAEDPLVSLEHHGVLENAALQKIRQSRERGTLIDAAGLGLVIFAWETWSTVDEVRGWLLEMFEDDANFASLINIFLNRSLRATTGSVFTRENFSLETEVFQRYNLAKSDVAERIRRLNISVLTDVRQATAKTLLALLEEPERTEDAQE